MNPPETSGTVDIVQPEQEAFHQRSHQCQSLAGIKRYLYAATWGYPARQRVGSDGPSRDNEKIPDQVFLAMSKEEEKLRQASPTTEPCCLRAP